MLSKVVWYVEVTSYFMYVFTNQHLSSVNHSLNKTRRLQKLKRISHENRQTYSDALRSKSYGIEETHFFRKLLAIHYVFHYVSTGKQLPTEKKTSKAFFTIIHKKKLFSVVDFGTLLHKLIFSIYRAF